VPNLPTTGTLPVFTPRRLLFVAGLFALPLTACDRTETPKSTASPNSTASPGTTAAAPAPTPAGHAELWARYLAKHPADADAGWVLDGGGLPETHLYAMWVNLKTTFRATGWALARSTDGSRYKLVAEFNTSGDALKMLSLDPSGTRYNALAVFDPPADTVVDGAAQLADDLLNAALTRLNVVRAQSVAYAAANGGVMPDLSSGWNALTRASPPLLTADPINPLTGSAQVAPAPGPDVGWVNSGAAPLRLSVPASWIAAYPQLVDDAAPF